MEGNNLKRISPHIAEETMKEGSQEYLLASVRTNVSNKWLPETNCRFYSRLCILIPHLFQLLNSPKNYWSLYLRTVQETCEMYWIFWEAWISPLPSSMEAMTTGGGWVWGDPSVPLTLRWTSAPDTSLFVWYPESSVCSGVHLNKLSEAEPRSSDLGVMCRIWVIQQGRRASLSHIKVQPSPCIYVLRITQVPSKPVNLISSPSM